MKIINGSSINICSISNILNEDSLAAADFNMTPEMYAEISRLSRTPAPATDQAEVLTGKWS